MSDRYKGGILSGTAPTVTPQGANGVYTLSQQMQYQGQGVWPTAAQNPITQSLRFRSSASAYLNRTPATATNRTTWTWSGWVKRGALGVYSPLFIAGTTNGQQVGSLAFSSAGGVYDKLELNFGVQGTSTEFWLQTTQVFRDPSAWYHIVCAVDTTQATASNRVKFYVNGTQVTALSSYGGYSQYPSQNYNTSVNNTVQHLISRDQVNTAGYFDGYMGEVNFIDGVQLTPSSFGTTDVNGIWQPIPYTGAYGTNGFYLPFSDIALTSGSNAGLGKDFSGNGNYWNTNNISVTSGTTYDSMLDSPSNASPTIGNYSTLNPINGATATVVPTNGNLTCTWGGAQGNASIGSTLSVSSGKWYFEATLTTVGGSFPFVGIIPTQSVVNSSLSEAGYTNNNWVGNGQLSAGDVVGVAFDLDTLTFNAYKNGTAITVASGGKSSDTIVSGIASWMPTISGIAGTVWNVNFGQQPFVYTPPTGFNRLNTYNLPEPTIPAGNKVMDATLWTGNGGTQAITNAGAMKPDFVWIKGRNAGYYHCLQDSIRGVASTLFSNDTLAEETSQPRLSSFNGNGFTLTSKNDANNSGDTYVGWQWQAGQGVNTSNTNGSITSTVSVNQAAGFSIVTYTGVGGVSTVGHGLGVVPAMYILKNRTNSSDWRSYHAYLNGGVNPQNYAINLNNTSAQFALSDGAWNNTAPTSSVFTINGTGNEVNQSGSNYVAYCWAPVAGFSAFGSYTGNGSVDGPFVYTGFRPKYVMFKLSSNSGEGWILDDTSRSPYNVCAAQLQANSSGAEVSGDANTYIDILSNGFKMRTTAGSHNTSGYTYIYMAFAENPFKLARAR